MTEISDRYRSLADLLAARVREVPADDPRWAAASPCEGWTALDVMAHVIDTHDNLLSLIGREVVDRPPVSADPLLALTRTRDAMVSFLEEPTIAGQRVDGPVGPSTWEIDVDRLVCGDVLVHTWDIARAVGLDETLPAEAVRRYHHFLRGLGDVIRGPKLFGPAVEPATDADDQERLLAFTGRDQHPGPR